MTVALELVSLRLLVVAERLEVVQLSLVVDVWVPLDEVWVKLLVVVIVALELVLLLLLVVAGRLEVVQLLLVLLVVGVSVQLDEWVVLVVPLLDMVVCVCEVDLARLVVVDVKDAEV